MDSEYDEPPLGEAQSLLENPLLQSLFSEMEASAFEDCVDARPDDDERRRIAMQKVQAIRDLRAQLKTLAEGKTKRPQKRTIA